MEEIVKKIDDLLSDVSLDIESPDENIQMTDELEDLMEKVEKADKPYKLAFEDSELYLKLSLLCFHNDRLDQAEKWVKKSLRLENTFDGFFLKGRILQEKKDNKGAIGEYDEALKYEDKAKVHEYKYRALKARGMHDRALSSLEKALDVNENASLLAEKADILIDLGEMEKAKELYDRVEAIDPEIDNKEKKIKQLLKEAQDKIVPEKYDKILELDDRNIKAWLGKGETLWKLNQRDEARSTMKEAFDKIKSDEISNKLEEYQKDMELAPDCEECGGTGECPNCEGSGNCIRCSGSGNCKDCEGTADCHDCSGTGECSNCAGEGKTGWFRKCKVCSGTGNCQTCEGYGDCSSCDGTGDCQRCGGNKNCLVCQGSGICTSCDGEGLKVD